MDSTSEATAEVFWTAFRALSKKDREAIVKKFLNDDEFIEDITDSVILKNRANEPSRPLSEYLAERKMTK